MVWGSSEGIAKRFAAAHEISAGSNIAAPPAPPAISNCLRVINSLSPLGALVLSYAVQWRNIERSSGALRLAWLHMVLSPIGG
jgi:hypothetical protein